MCILSTDLHSVIYWLPTKMLVLVSGFGRLFRVFIRELRYLSQSMYVMLRCCYDIQIEHLKKMCGTIMTPAKELEPSIETVSHKYENLALPKEFDARKKWDSCPTIGTILGWKTDICSLRMLFVF